MRKRYLRHLTICTISGIFLLGGCQFIPKKENPQLPNSPKEQRTVIHHPELDMSYRAKSGEKDLSRLGSEDLSRVVLSSSKNAVEQQPVIQQRYSIQETPKPFPSAKETRKTPKRYPRKANKNDAKPRTAIPSKPVINEKKTRKRPRHSGTQPNNGNVSVSKRQPSVTSQPKPETSMPSNKEGRPLRIEDVRVYPLELFDAPAGEFVGEREEDNLEFPIEVLAISSNGRFKINLDGKTYWVDTALVKTNRKHYVCFDNPKGVVIHDVLKVTRGLGECQ